MRNPRLFIGVIAALIAVASLTTWLAFDGGVPVRTTKVGVALGAPSIAAQSRSIRLAQSDNSGNDQEQPSEQQEQQTEQQQQQQQQNPPSDN